MITGKNGSQESRTARDHETVDPVPAPTKPSSPHEVLRVLAARRDEGSQPLARDDGLRIALVVEGGGMRGIISGGMALALYELRLVPAFDAIYGSSAGAITGAWLLSRPEGLRGWAEPAYARILIRRSALLRGRPVTDVRALIEDLYQTTFPLDFAAVLASPVELHPLATDAATGQSTDLRPFIGNPAELRLALRASASLPLLAGPPVEFAGRRFYDAGVSESVPYRTALAQGATHLLILRSRRDPRPLLDGHRPPRSARLLARTTLRRETPALRATFLARESRLAADDQLLAEYEADPAHTPAVFSIRPPADSPQVSRLATDGALLHAALETGRAAVLSTITKDLVLPIDTPGRGALRCPFYPSIAPFVPPRPPGPARPVAGRCPIDPARTGTTAHQPGKQYAQYPEQSHKTGRCPPRAGPRNRGTTRGARRRRRPGRRGSTGGPTGCRSGRPRAAWPGTRWLPLPRSPNGIRCCG
jgi:predicted patatin/cPLA2 family phospholipase